LVKGGNVAIQTKIKCEYFCWQEDRHALETVSSIAPIQAASHDYNCEFDNDELGKELLAPLPQGISEQFNPVVAADEFDTLYRWFVS
jgi:hypothetical protein